MKQIFCLYLKPSLRKRAHNIQHLNSKMAGVAMAMQKKNGSVSVKIFFFTKIYIPAKFEENHLQVQSCLDMIKKKS